MALLRNREVTIERVASEIDESTFQVRYKDGESEYAKLHELEMTRREYEEFVHAKLPEVKIINEPEAKLELKAAKKK